ncbi:MAG: heme-binding protein [Steroidobacter sp.]|nr:heme-binding protein [Steroidobacter sp.]MBL8266957.1 heme-binding protein [Steroidobacter sp.]
MSYLRTLLAACVLCVGPTALGQSAASDSALGAAEKMIASCFAYAAANKMPPVSVVVVDASGALIAAKRQDGAMPVSGDAALLKARTSIRTRAPTAVLSPIVQGDAGTRDAFITMQLTAIPGGVPFSRGTEAVAGAVGVSGAHPDQDAACATSAVGAVKASS